MPRAAAERHERATAIGLDASKAAGSNHQLYFGTKANAPIDAAGEQVKAGGNFTLGAASNQISTVTTTAAGSGFINAAIADTSVHVGYNTTATVGAGATITAAGNIRATADGKTNASTKATAYAVGFGAGADADYATSGGIQIGDSGTPPAQSQVEIGSGSNLNGQTVTLLASNSEIAASANDSATSFSPILLGVTTAFANANVDAMPSATVLIDNTIGVSPATQLTGSQGVDILAFNAVPAIIRTFYFLSVSIIPPQGGAGTGSYTPSSAVTAAAGATVFTAPRSLTGGLAQNVPDYRYQNDDSSSHSLDNLALNVQSFNLDASPSEVSSHVGTIDWESNVTISNPDSPAVLTIDSSGTITQEQGVTVTDSTNTPLSIGQTIGTSTVNVSTTGGSGALAYFTAQDQAFNTSTYPLFTFNDALSGVTITNNSAANLNIQDINIIPTGAAAQSEVRLDAPGLGPVDGPIGFNFDIAHGSGSAIVDIENADPTQTGSQITLSGTIDNPLGQTIINNTRGDVLAGTPIAGLIRTNTLDVEASGNVGASPTAPIAVEMVRADDENSTETPIPQISATAGGSVNFSITGREGAGLASPMAIHTGQISAGGDVTLLLNPAVQDGAPSGSTIGLLVTRTQQVFSGKYISHFLSTGAQNPGSFDSGRVRGHREPREQDVHPDRLRLLQLQRRQCARHEHGPAGDRRRRQHHHHEHEHATFNARHADRRQRRRQLEPRRDRLGPAQRPDRRHHQPVRERRSNAGRHDRVDGRQRLAHQRGRRLLGRRHHPRIGRGHLRPRGDGFHRRLRQLHHGRRQHHQHPLGRRDQDDLRQQTGERHHPGRSKLCAEQQPGEHDRHQRPDLLAKRARSPDFTTTRSA